LTSHAKRYVSNQEYPKKIFHGLIDLCWKRQWIIPTYHELASIVTHCLNVADRELISAVEQTLTDKQIEYLEALLAPIQNAPSAGSVAPLTQLKRIDQSLKAGNIRHSMKTLALFRDHFMFMLAQCPRSCAKRPDFSADSLFFSSSLGQSCMPPSK
jgi:hypothetical protein